MKNYELLRNNLLAGTLIASVSLTGCDYTSPPEPLEANEIFNFSETEVVRPGEVKILKPMTDLESARELVRRVKLTDSRKREGTLLEDSNAPTLESTSPLRIDAEVSLQGEGSDRINNDAACDVINIDTSGLNENHAYIVGLNLSSTETDYVSLAWPHNLDGSIGKTALLCVSDKEEPTYGVVVGITDQQR